MAAQMTYGYKTPSGVPGLIFDIAPYECNSRVSEENAGIIKFGLGVVVGTAKGTGVKLPTAASDNFEGVVVEKAHELNKDGEVVIDNGEAFSVMRFGGVWARVDESVTIAPEDKAYLIVTGDKAGQFTNADSGNLDIHGEFITANEDGIAALRLFNA